MAYLTDIGGFRITGSDITIHDDDQTLRVRCTQCAAAGESRDLQASWSKVAQRLRDLLADENAGIVDYPVGGTLLH